MCACVCACVCVCVLGRLNPLELNVLLGYKDAHDILTLWRRVAF